MRDFKQLKSALESLTSGERNFIANAANFSSLIFNNMNDLNWVGFYFRDADELVLGPFCGQPACIRIEIGKGVTGKSAQLKQAIVVADVHHFSGHIACDPNSKSEIVLPIIKNDLLYGVLDLDSPILSRFNDNDNYELNILLQILINNSDVEAIAAYYKI